jgi:hypothetical protein
VIKRAIKFKMMKIAALAARILIIGIALSPLAVFPQASPEFLTKAPAGPNAKAMDGWYTAWKTKNWNSLVRVVADGFTFSSPLDDHINLAKVKERCWPNAYNIKRVEFEKVVITGDNAFVVANGYTNSGKLFRNCDSFQFKDGKIIAYECFFGPGINYPNSGK